MTTESLISEIALRCGDSELKDFHQDIYERAVYRSNREIAKKYGILKKTLSFELRDMVSTVDEEMSLDIPDFKSEFLVVVNGITLIKVANKIESDFRGVYYMEFRDGTLYFDYSLGINSNVTGQNISGQDITTTMSQSLFERIEEGEVVQTYKTMDDVIYISYSIIPGVDTEIGEYDIPGKFEEEQIGRAVNYMAKLGKAKFAGTEEKLKKYQQIYLDYQIEEGKSEYDKDIAQDSEWVKIIPWSVV